IKDSQERLSVVPRAEGDRLANELSSGPRDAGWRSDWTRTDIHDRCCVHPLRMGGGVHHGDLTTGRMPDQDEPFQADSIGKLLQVRQAGVGRVVGLWIPFAVAATALV